MIALIEHVNKLRFVCLAASYKPHSCFKNLQCHRDHLLVLLSLLISALEYSWGRIMTTPALLYRLFQVYIQTMLLNAWAHLHKKSRNYQKQLWPWSITSVDETILYTHCYCY